MKDILFNSFSEILPVFLFRYIAKQKAEIRNCTSTQNGYLIRCRKDIYIQVNYSRKKDIKNIDKENDELIEFF